LASFILLAVLSMSISARSTAASTMDIAMRIQSGDIVDERVTLRINSTQAYDAFEYQTASKPLSTSYDGTFHVRDHRDDEPGEGLARDETEESAEEGDEHERPDPPEDGTRYPSWRSAPAPRLSGRPGRTRGAGEGISRSRSYKAKL
jgi:hypothetical protein